MLGFVVCAAAMSSSVPSVHGSAAKITSYDVTASSRMGKSVRRNSPTLPASLYTGPTTDSSGGWGVRSIGGRVAPDPRRSGNGRMLATTSAWCAFVATELARLTTEREGRDAVPPVDHSRRKAPRHDVVGD